MRGYLLDTSVISAQLDEEHDDHDKIRQAIEQLDPAEPLYLSAMSLAETTMGLRMVESFQPSSTKRLKEVVRKARRREAIPVTRHTAMVYALLKAKLAKCYLAKPSRKDRPRWVEDWVDKATGKKLHVDENDLWMCAQAKERDLVFVTADDKIRKRVSKADPSVRFLVL